MLKINSILSAYIFVLISWTMGCSTNIDSDARNNVQGSKITESEDASESGVDEPIMTGGAFLTCNIDERFESEKDDEVVSCHFADKKGKKISGDLDYTVKPSLASGAEESKLDFDIFFIDGIKHWVLLVPKEAIANGKISFEVTKEGAQSESRNFEAEIAPFSDDMKEYKEIVRGESSGEGLVSMKPIDADDQPAESVEEVAEINNDGLQLIANGSFELASLTNSSIDYEKLPHWEGKSSKECEGFVQHSDSYHEKNSLELAFGACADKDFEIKHEDELKVDQTYVVEFYLKMENMGDREFELEVSAGGAKKKIVRSGDQDWQREVFVFETDKTDPLKIKRKKSLGAALVLIDAIRISHSAKLDRDIQESKDSEKTSFDESISLEDRQDEMQLPMEKIENLQESIDDSIKMAKKEEKVSDETVNSIEQLIDQLLESRAVLVNAIDSSTSMLDQYEGKDKKELEKSIEDMEKRLKDLDKSIEKYQKELEKLQD